MSKISGIVITKNEEDIIADCLDSLEFCDEIIVVDNDSEDRTVEIAKRMGARVFKINSNNFSELRNFGLQKAKNEWVLYVDADERVTEELQREITHLTRCNGRSKQLNGYFLKRKNFYFENYEWPYIERLERLFRKDKLKGWRGKLHESPVVIGGDLSSGRQVGEIEEGFLLHYTHRNLSSMLKKTIEWSKIEAKLRFNARHPKVTWWRLLRVMATAFFDSYIRQRGWKVGVVGIIESIYQSFSIFVTYARLWELQSKLKNKNEK